MTPCQMMLLRYLYETCLRSQLIWDWTELEALISKSPFKQLIFSKWQVSATSSKLFSYPQMDSEINSKQTRRRSSLTQFLPSHMLGEWEALSRTLDEKESMMWSKNASSQSPSLAKIPSLSTTLTPKRIASSKDGLQRFLHSSMTKTFPTSNSWSQQWTLKDMHTASSNSS